MALFRFDASSHAISMNSYLREQRQEFYGSVSILSIWPIYVYWMVQNNLPRQTDKGILQIRISILNAKFEVKKCHRADSLTIGYQFQ